MPQYAVLQQQACEKSGGRWGGGGAAGFFVCYKTTRDALVKSCRAATDCEGLCLARSRSCVPVTPLFGCHSILDTNGQPETICID